MKKQKTKCWGHSELTDMGDRLEITYLECENFDTKQKVKVISLDKVIEVIRESNNNYIVKTAYYNNFDFIHESQFAKNVRVLKPITKFKATRLV